MTNDQVCILLGIIVGASIASLVYSIIMYRESECEYQEDKEE